MQKYSRIHLNTAAKKKTKIHLKLRVTYASVIELYISFSTIGGMGSNPNL
jgi:hypothetical protein